MNLSEEQLKEVEEMAGLFFNPEDIAINLELSEDDKEQLVMSIYQKLTHLDYVRAYKKGWLTTEVELRKAIKQSAMNGSSPSQGMMMEYQRNNRTI